MSEYLPEFSRIRRMICVALGHQIISGRGFVYGDESFDLKWNACRRCFMWMPEGGVEQLEHEIEASRPRPAPPPQEREAGKG